MARHEFYASATRLSSGVAIAAGVTYVVYSDSAGTVLADIAATSGGSSIAGSTRASDANGVLNFFGPPSGASTLYLRCPALPFGLQRIDALADPRIDRLEGIQVNVRDHGAVMDGTTLDTAAFTAARDAAGVDGTVVVPGDGTALVAQIELSVAGQRWKLEQGATVKLAGSASVGQAAFHVLADRVTIEGPGTVDGNGVGQTVDAHGIRTAFAFTTIDGVTVQNGKAHNIVGLGSSLLVVRNCKLYGSLTDGPILVRPDSSGAASLTDVVVEGCTIDQSGISAATVNGAGIKLIGFNAGAQVNDARITGNRVIMPLSPTGVAIAIEGNFCPRLVVAGNNTYGGHMGISVVQAAGATISGNTVRSAKTYGVEAGGAQGTVSGNAIDGSNIATAIGIQAVPGGGDGAISGNTVVNVPAGIQVQSCLRTAIIGNLVRASSTNLIGLAAADGSTVAGNILDGGGTCNIGIATDDTNDLSIVGNTIRNCDVKGIELYSDTAAYTIEYVSIAGNVFRSTTEPIKVTISGGAAYSISTIRVLGNVGAPDDVIVT